MDVNEYLKKQRKNQNKNGTAKYILLMVGITVISALYLVFSDSSLVNQYITKNDFLKYFKSLEKTIELPSTQLQQGQLRQERPKDRKIKESYIESESGKRQTVFNDFNYKPVEPVNIIQSPPIPSRSTANTKPKQKSQAPIILMEREWRWESQGSGFNKKTKRGFFTFEIRNNIIFTPTVCKNYRYGSLDYRDCRKAAKKIFQNECKGGDKISCSGADMMP